MSISIEEFGKLQTNLISLKQDKMELEEAQRRNTAEIKRYQTLVTKLEKEKRSLEGVITKSKEKKAVADLQMEIDRLGEERQRDVQEHADQYMAMRSIAETLQRELEDMKRASAANTPMPSAAATPVVSAAAAPDLPTTATSTADAALAEELEMQKKAVAEHAARLAALQSEFDALRVSSSTLETDLRAQLKASEDGREGALKELTERKSSGTKAAAELEEVHRRVTALESEARELAIREAAAKEQVAALSKSESSAREALLVAQAGAKSASERLAEHDKKHDLELATLNEEIARLQTAVSAAASGATEDTSKQMATLHEEINSLKSKVKSAEHDRDESVSKMQTELSGAVASAEFAKAELATLNQQLEASRATEASLNAEISHLKETLARSQAELSSAQEASTTAKELIETGNKALADVKQELAACKQELSAAKHAHDQSATAATATDGKLRALEQEVAQLKEAHAKETAQHADLQRKLKEEKDAAVSALRTAEQEAAVALKRTTDNLSESDGKVVRLEESLNSSTERIRDLEARLQASETEREEVKQALKAAKEKAKALPAVDPKLAERIKALEQSLAQMTSKAANAETEASDAKDKLQTMKVSRDAVMKQISEMKDQLDATKEQNDIYMQQLGSLKESLTIVQEENTGLSKKVESIKKELEAAKQDANKARVALNATAQLSEEQQAQIAQLQQNLQEKHSERESESADKAKRIAKLEKDLAQQTARSLQADDAVKDVEAKLAAAKEETAQALARTAEKDTAIAAMREEYVAAERKLTELRHSLDDTVSDWRRRHDEAVQQTEAMQAKLLEQEQAMADAEAERRIEQRKTETMIKELKLQIAKGGSKGGERTTIVPSKSATSLALESGGESPRSDVAAARIPLDASSMPTAEALQLENNQLVIKIAELQSQKWELDEAASEHAARINALMKESDGKSAIIGALIEREGGVPPPEAPRGVFGGLFASKSTKPAASATDRIKLQEVVERALIANRSLTTEVESLRAEVGRLAVEVVTLRKNAEAS